MVLSALKTKITQHLVNIPGWRTDRKIIVIESDDWGSIRMPSKTVYDQLLRSGYLVDRCPYNRFDTLADPQDLSYLFELLASFRDKNGCSPVITANNIVANPDFDKIRDSGFQTYYYEPFTTTMTRYPGRPDSLSLWKEGMEENVFHPQFHGREHLNVHRWLQGLQEGNQELRLAFDHRMISFNNSSYPTCINAGMDALTFESDHEKSALIQLIQEGLHLFKDQWGFPSKSFIAPCYFWDAALESTLWEQGVRYLQGNYVQKNPVQAPGKKFKKIYHYLGQKNRYGQLYLIRNCYFEPSLSSKVDWVNNCLQEISTAFRWKKPAIISAHRLNFIGSIVPENRDNTLSLLKQLFVQITKQWPEVEFFTSDRLGDLIQEDQ